MTFNPDDRISVAEALEASLALVEPLASESVALRHARGRVLAQDIVSDIDVSPFASSAMDGYAVQRCDLETASPEAPVVLDVLANMGAGQVFDGCIASGQTVRIMTGAPIPEGADAVVKYEVVGIESGDGGAGSRVSFTEPAKPQQNVRGAGEEFRQGDVVLTAGSLVNPYAMGLIASAGYVNVDVYRRPVVGILSIGSELVSAPTKPGPGMIRDCNQPCLTGLAEEAGAEVRLYGIVEDEPQAIEAKLTAALAECDMVVTAGGASKGDFDYINAIIERLGRTVFAYISLRPGKRQTLGVIDGKPVFGLSGNPAAAAVGFELLIRPALRKMQGFAYQPRAEVTARLLHDVKKKEDRAYYQRGLVSRGEDGAWVACEYGTQSSALLGDLERCNCLIRIPEESRGMKAGEEVVCLRIDLPEGALS